MPELKLMWTDSPDVAEGSPRQDVDVRSMLLQHNGVPVDTRKLFELTVKTIFRQHLVFPVNVLEYERGVF